MVAKVNIKGVIASNSDYEIYEWLGMEAICPKKVIAELETAKAEMI
ncbi:MAG: hypothetical protein NHB14_27305 [Desulfosporosinus sp.]|nr:hypothetical protein [Desulfosporosinus sp.]